MRLIVGETVRGGARQPLVGGNAGSKRVLLDTNTLQPTPIYDYFMRSISSANDQPADEDWMRWMERLLGYCLLGSLPYHIWPLWTGEGGNGKSCLARILHYIMGDFCALVRWSELTHDERGGDSTQKRLNYRLIGARAAIVE